MRKLHWTAVALVLFLFPGSSAALAKAPSFAPPVDGPISEPFHMKANRFEAGSHRGVDYGIPAGTPVRAAADGRVTFAGQVGGNLAITLEHGNGLETTYSFLESVEVLGGQHTRRGEFIGSSGPGHGNRDALHLGAKKDGEYIDPALLFIDYENISNLIQLVDLD